MWGGRKANTHSNISPGEEKSLSQVETRRKKRRSYEEDMFEYSFEEREQPRRQKTKVQPQVLTSWQKPRASYLTFHLLQIRPTAMWAVETNKHRVQMVVGNHSQQVLLLCSFISLPGCLDRKIITTEFQLLLFSPKVMSDPL